MAEAISEAVSVGLPLPPSLALSRAFSSSSRRVCRERRGGFLPGREAEPRRCQPLIKPLAGALFKAAVWRAAF